MTAIRALETLVGFYKTTYVTPQKTVLFMVTTVRTAYGLDKKALIMF
jgi:hypothetical protein